MELTGFDPSAFLRRLGVNQPKPVNLRDDLALELGADAGELVPPLVGIRAAATGIRFAAAGLRMTGAFTSRSIGGSLVDAIFVTTAIAVTFDNGRFPFTGATTPRPTIQRGIGSSNSLLEDRNEAANLTTSYSIQGPGYIPIGHYVDPGASLSFQAPTNTACAWTLFWRDFQARRTED